MEKHVQILAVLYIAFGVLLLAIGIGLFVVIAGAGVISGDLEALAITGAVGTFIGIIFLILSVPSIIAGFGLLRYRPWARILALILGVLQIANVPFGTALGIYTLWVLINDRTQPLFGGGTTGAAAVRT